MGLFELLVELRLPSKLRKLNITQAADELRKLGYHLLGGAAFDSQSMSARYRVRLPNGSEKVMTVYEIGDILQGEN